MEVEEDNYEFHSSRTVLLEDMSPNLIEDSSHFGSQGTSISNSLGHTSNLQEYQDESIVALLEDISPNPIEDSSHFGSQGTSISNSLGHTSNLQEYQDENIDTNLTGGLSNSYVAAFQQERDEGISRSEAIKYFFSFVGSFGPVVPQIPIAMIMARQHFHSDVVGYMMIGTGIVSISTINTWMINELIDDTHRFFKGTDRPRSNTSIFSCNSLKNIGLGVSCIFLGCLGSAPSVFLNYKYNRSIPYALITFIYEAIPKIVGYYKFSSLLSVDSTKRLFQSSNPDERKGVQVVDLSQAFFLRKCNEKGIENVRMDLSHFSSPNEVYSYLSSGEITIEELPPEFARGIPKKIIKYSSIIFPLISSGFPSALAYGGYKLIFTDESVAGLFTALSVSPIFFLSSYAFMRVVGNIYDKFFSCRLPIPSSDYLTNFHPKLNVAFKCTTLLISSVSAIVLYFLFMDNTDDMLADSIQYPIAITTVITGFVFDSFTINTSLKQHGEFMCRMVSKSAAYAIGCTKKLGKLASSFINFSSTLIKKFVDEAISEYENL